MGMFSKNDGVDVLDLPELHRRGILKLPAPEPIEDDLVDLTKPVQPSILTTSPTAPPSLPAPHAPTHSGVTDFLSDFASIGAATPLVTTESATPSVPAVAADTAVADLKWRLENTEYKLEQLIERLAKLEERRDN